MFGFFLKGKLEYNYNFDGALPTSVLKKQSLFIHQKKFLQQLPVPGVPPCLYLGAGRKKTTLAMTHCYQEKFRIYVPY